MLRLYFHWRSIFPRGHTHKHTAATEGSTHAGSCKCTRPPWALGSSRCVVLVASRHRQWRALEQTSPSVKGDGLMSPFKFQKVPFLEECRWSHLFIYSFIGSLGLHRSPPNIILTGSAIFLLLTSVVTNTETDHATSNISSNRPHLCTACRWCGLKIHTCNGGNILPNDQIGLGQIRWTLW